MSIYSLILSVILVFFSSSSMAAPSDTNTLSVQLANKGSLTVIPSQPGIYQLVLTDVHPFVTTFTDRPARKARLISTEEFLAYWNQGKNNFSKNAPNADISLIQLAHGKAKPFNFTMELIDKQYSAKQHKMTYTIRVLGKETMPRSLVFDYSALFIDGCCCINC